MRSEIIFPVQKSVILYFVFCFVFFFLAGWAHDDGFDQIKTRNTEGILACGWFNGTCRQWSLRSIWGGHNYGLTGRSTDVTSFARECFSPEFHWCDNGKLVFTSPHHLIPRHHFAVSIFLQTRNSGWKAIGGSKIFFYRWLILFMFGWK